MIEPPRGLDGSQLPDIMEAGDSRWFNMDKLRWPLLCRQGPAQPDVGHTPTFDTWLGSIWSLWKSSEFLGIKLQLLVEVFQQNLPNSCACPFQVCSILLQLGTTWVPSLHQYLCFMAPWPQNACVIAYFISLRVGPTTLQSFPPFTVGETPKSRLMDIAH